MSINAELIAEFFGRLRFDTDVSGLKRFDAMLATASKRMTALGKQADALKSKLNTTFGVTGKGASAERLKQSAALQRSMDKEFTLEQKQARAKEAVFKAQLMQQKLVSAGTKEQVFLQNAALKSQQLAAVASAKEQQLLQQKLRTRHGEAKLGATLDQAKLRQAKLQDVLIRRQQRSQQLQRQAAKDATSLQRAEQSLIAARQRGIQLAEKHVISKAATAARESRAAERHEQQAQRFSMQQDRFQAWKTRQAEPQGGGLGSFSVGLGGAAAALYALTAAVGYAAKRVEERQSGVVEAQGFNNLFMGISKNQKIGESYRQAFIKAQMDNGGSIDTDTAKDFRTLAVNMAAAGKTQAKILETWNTRQQAFAVAGTSREDNKELNKQMGQMASDGTGAASDANIINDRMPMLTPFVVREFMKDRGIKDYAKGLAQYNKDLKGGKGVKSVWYEEAMRNLVAENQPSLERNRNSVASQQQRADNQAYLNTNNANSNAELAGVIGERIQAERDLNTAMVPLQQTLATFDLGLTKLSTYMLRIASGRDIDGNEKSEQQQIQDRMSTNDVAVDTKMVGVGDYSAINGETQHQGGPLGKFYNWLFNVKDYSKDGEANKAKALTPNLLGMQFNKIDVSKFTANGYSGPSADDDGSYHQFRPYQPYTYEDTVAAASLQQRMREPVQPSWLLANDPNSQTINKPVESNIDQSHTEINVSVSVDARGMSQEGAQKFSAEAAREAMKEEFRSTLAAQKEVQ